MYKTRMAFSTHPARIIESFHYLPDQRWAGSLATIKRAGHITAGPDYSIARARNPGDDLLYCIAGAGHVTVNDTAHPVRAGQLTWIAGDRPHGHAADPADPWTLLWCRIDGPTVAACRTGLLGADTVITIPQGAVLLDWFQRIFTALRDRGPETDLVLNALVADLLLILSGARMARPDRTLPTALARLTAAMGARPGQPWTEAEMQHITRVSPAHLRRMFRTHLQVTPRAWLRRERIMLAQGHLLRPGSRVSDVAELCGFSDIYHFSREFRRSVGQSPTEWRRAETGAAPLKPARIAAE